MADRIADLVIRLKADSAQLDRELRRTESQVKSTADRMRRAFDAIRPGLIAVGAAVAAGTTALAVMARRALDSADNLGKAADRIGVTTESLQRLGFAADLAGVSTEQFQKGLETFVRRLGEAAGGTGELINGLKDLDPTLLSNLSSARNTEEAFLLVADAVASTEDPARRAAIAYSAFGRSGVALVNVLAQGRDAIRAQGDELERFGGLLSREAAQAAEDFNDALTELATFASTRFTTAFLGADGSVRPLTERLRDPEVRQGISDLADGMARLAKMIAEVGAAAAEQFAEITKFFNKIGELRDRLGTFLANRTQRFFGSDLDTGRQLVQTPNFSAQLRALGFDENGNPIRVSSAPAPIAPQLLGFDPSGRGAGSAASKAAREAEKAARERERAEERLTQIVRDSVEQRLRAQEREADLIGLRATAELAQLDELAKLLPGKEAELQSARIQVIQGAQAEIAKVYADAAEKLAEEERRAQEEREEALKQSFERIGNFIGDTIGGLLLQQEKDWNAFFRSLAASFVSSGIQNLFADLAASAAAPSAAGGGKGGFLASLLKVGGLFFADGGIVRRPTLGVVGEAGPEAVIPLDKLRGLTGNVEVNIIGAPVQPTNVRQRRGADGRQILDVMWESSAQRASARGFGRSPHTPGTAG